MAGTDQHSLLEFKLSAGTSSAWSWSKIFCMKAKYWAFIVGFLSRVRRVDFRRFMALPRLVGSSLTAWRRGSGASQLPFSSFVMPCSMISRKLRSSVDVHCLLSCCVRTNTLRAKPSSNALPKKGVSSWSPHAVVVVSCLTWKRLGQGTNSEGRPS